MTSLPLILCSIGSIGAMAVWLFFVRPYVVSHGQGHRTGANVSVAFWVDWQACGEIAKAEDDEKGRKIYRAFWIFQFIAAFGLVLLFCGIYTA